MSFTTHEMLLMLRARDEASRVLRRVSGNLQASHNAMSANNSALLDDYAKQKAAIITNVSNAKQLIGSELIQLANKRRDVGVTAKAAVTALEQEIGKVKLKKTEVANAARLAKIASDTEVAAINKTMRTHSNNLKIQRGAASTLRILKAEQMISYRQEAAEIKKNANLTKSAQKVALQALTKAHRETIDSYDSEIIGIRKVIDKKNEYIRRLDVKKQKVVSTAAAVAKSYQNEIGDLSALEAKHGAQIRSVITSANSRIASIRQLEQVDKTATTNMLANSNKELTKIRELELAERQRLRAVELARRKELALMEANAQRMSTLGTAYTSSGIAMLGAGAMTAHGLNQAADASIEYRKAASTTFTQVDGRAKTSLNGIIKFGREIADNYAVPFEEIQPTLYDIYSSVDATNEQVKDIMRQASTAAVGGATTTKIAAEALISIMNSYGMKVKDVGKINDTMFQLVRKGVGNFGQFTTAMGKATPSAKRAGQSIEQVSAMLALMTRNGMKVGTVGTYAARAMDAIANPKLAENMKKFGISIHDSAGEIRPMSAIIADMKKKMDGLPTSKKSAMLKEMFAGAGGNIQALKFFNTALNDTSGLYDTLLTDMKNATTATDKNGKAIGAAAIAYQEMANTDAAKLQENANDIALAVQYIGDAIIPVKVAFSEFFGAIASAFNKLSPGMKSFVTNIGIAFAAITILSGIILAVTGTILMFAAAAATAAIPIAAIAWPVLAVVAAVAALAAIGYLLVSNWQTVSAFFQPLMDALAGGWKYLSKTIVDAWNAFLPYFQQGITAITDMWNMWQPMIQNLIAGFGEMSAKIAPFIQALAKLAGFIVQVVIANFIVLWKIITSIIANMLPGLMALGAGIMGVVGGIMDFISGLISIFTGDFSKGFEKLIAGIGQIFGGLVTMIVGILGSLGGAVWGIIKGVVDGIIAFFVYLWDVLVGHSIIPDMVMSIIKWFASLPGAVFGFVANLVSGVVKWFGNLAAKVISSVANFLVNVVKFWRSLPGKVIAAIASLTASLASTGKAWFDRLSSAVVSGIAKVVGFAKGIPGKIKGALGSVGSILYSAGASIISGFLRGLKSMWDNVTGWVGGIANWIANNKGPISKDFKLLQPAGKAIMKGLHTSMRDGMSDIRRDVSDVNSILALRSSGNTASYASIYDRATSSKTGKVEINIHTQEIDPKKHGADVGFEIARMLGF